jgi:hypothetical protein
MWAPPKVLRIRDVYQGFRILIFIHPGSNNSNKRGGGKIFCPTFFVTTNITKFITILLLNCETGKKFAPINKELWYFTKKIVTKLSKIRVWDTGSVIQDPEKTYSGNRIQGSRRHQITDQRDHTSWIPSRILKSVSFSFSSNMLIFQLAVAFSFYQYFLKVWMGIYCRMDATIGKHWDKKCYKQQKTIPDPQDTLLFGPHHPEYIIIRMVRFWVL